MTTPRRDEGAEAAAARGERDRAGNLERARDGQRLVLVPGGLDRRARAGEQHVVEMRIEARLDEQDRRHQSADLDRPLFDDREAVAGQRRPANGGVFDSRIMSWMPSAARICAPVP